MKSDHDQPPHSRRIPQRYTGRTLVVFEEPPAAMPSGVRVFDTSAPAPEGEGPVYFPHVGIAVVGPNDVLPQSLEKRVIAREPEQWRAAISSAPLPDDDSMAAAAQPTWGIDATGAAGSAYSGRGVIVAVLDTGFDAGHQDFAGRTIIRKALVPGSAPDDVDGHGTHCIGTACGSLQPVTGPRYGVAYESTIASGKVLNDDGFGKDEWIIAGIDWAISIGARVVSMSLGSSVQPGEAFYVAYEMAARRAMAAGAIVIAAAGNESARPGTIAPVGAPANCPSIFAVGAIDRNLRVAPFSCGQINPNGGEVNIAAPGVSIHSSIPGSRYATKSGTSMATPHVAGIAAQKIQASPGISPQALWNDLQNTAKGLSEPKSDVGSGLAQSP